MTNNPKMQATAPDAPASVFESGWKWVEPQERKPDRARIAGPDHLWCQACRHCNKPGIFYTSDPNMLMDIEPQHWVANYRREPTMAWTKEEVYCQACALKGKKVALDMKLQEQREDFSTVFRVVGRKRRFFMRLNTKTGRYVEHEEQEVEAKKRVEEQDRIARMQGR